jgi:membrane protein
MKTAVADLSRHVLPDPVAQLFQQMTQELGARRSSGLQLLSICAGTLWAALNGTWAMIYGLNRAYEVEERRSWWELAITIVGLTVSLAVTGGAALLLQTRDAGVEWLVPAIALSLSFAMLYRFAPSVREHEWRRSTPGAVCALVLWIGATFGARFYFDRVDDYARSYGHLNGVVMLLMWLYVTNGAILIGGEMNSEIEKAVAGKAGQAKPINLYS